MITKRSLPRPAKASVELYDDFTQQLVCRSSLKSLSTLRQRDAPNFIVNSSRRLEKWISLISARKGCNKK
jgi:hypothetical protein